MIDFTVNRAPFNTHHYYKLDFETGVVSAIGVVSINKSFAMLDTDFGYSGRKVYDYYKVYHQFFEIKDIISEIKYKESKSR